jgi:hypothetical protein
LFGIDRYPACAFIHTLVARLPPVGPQRRRDSRRYPFVRGFGPLIIIDGAPPEEEKRREKIWQGMRQAQSGIPDTIKDDTNP